MILTVTLNPSIDYLYTTTTLKLGHTNKMSNPTSNIGGKGINAGRAAALMGSDVILTGFLAGNNGETIEDVLFKENLFSLDFITLPNTNNRQAISIMHDDSIHTEITEEGPLVDIYEQKKIIEKITKIIEKNNEINVLCISGSVNTTNEFFYHKIINTIQKKIPDLKIILDISGNQLKNVLTDKSLYPFMIKPNIHEFNDLTNNKFKQKEDIITYLKLNPTFNNINLILVSCGADGAVVKYQNDIYDVSIPKIDVVNPTGAGDSTVGGFATSLENNLPIIDCIKYAMACGISNTQNSDVGLIKKEDVEKLIKLIKVELK